MKKTIRHILLCAALTGLLAAAVFCLGACKNQTAPETPETQKFRIPEGFETATLAPEDSAADETPAAETRERHGLRDGGAEGTSGKRRPEDGSTPLQARKVSFILEVTFADGTVKTFNLETGCDTVGEALTEEDLISGENGPYGLYVQEVCGERHVYEEDGTYWAFYVNGEYAVTGADSTEVENGVTYAFKAE